MSFPFPLPVAKQRFDRSETNIGGRRKDQSTAGDRGFFSLSYLKHFRKCSFFHFEKRLSLGDRTNNRLNQQTNIHTGKKRFYFCFRSFYETSLKFAGELYLAIYIYTWWFPTYNRVASSISSSLDSNQKVKARFFFYLAEVHA